MARAGEAEIVRARAARREKRAMVRMVAVCGGVRRTDWGFLLSMWARRVDRVSGSVAESGDSRWRVE